MKTLIVFPVFGWFGDLKVAAIRSVKFHKFKNKYSNIPKNAQRQILLFFKFCLLFYFRVWGGQFHKSRLDIYLKIIKSKNLYIFQKSPIFFPEFFPFSHFLSSLELRKQDFIRGVKFQKQENKYFSPFNRPKWRSLYEICKI